MTAYLISLAAALAAAPVQDKAPDRTAQDDTQVIVITGQVDSARKEYEACLARKCPPLEDMAASLRYAEALFVEGEYQDARGVLRGATGRNRSHAQAHPREVSALYRAASRIAAHLGEGQEYERRAHGMVRALKAGLPEAAPEVLLAQIEVARTQTSLGNIPAAIAVLEAAHNVAERSGQKAVQGIAAVRLAALVHLRGGRSDARKLLAPLLEWDEPAMSQIRLAARILSARFDRAEGKPDNVDALIATLRTQPGQAPMLLKMEPLDIEWYDPRTARQAVGEATTVKVEHWNEPKVDKRWADIGFWVRPDGSVDDIEVLRDSNASKDWIDPVIAQVKSRVYAKSSAADGPGTYRVERFTLTALWGTVTGTHRRVREPRFRVERLDMTAEPAPSKDNGG
ncbi:hypothetical protein ABS767_15900 [Sphingomonas sp. ST-64]|uniref:TonB C-terminal domain-containing protein n=1 Tax=Sphingomonas plantiphila TaxID=3163295 RepID=A0ABW8YQJ5_9SPHN